MYVFVSTRFVFVVIRLSCHPRPSSVEALCTVGVLAKTQWYLRCQGKMASGTKRQPFVVVGVVAWSWSACSLRVHVCLGILTHLLDGLRWLKPAIVCVVVVAFSEVFVNVSFLRFVLLFVTVHVLYRLTNHVLVLHRLNEIRVPLHGFCTTQVAPLCFLATQSCTRDNLSWSFFFSCEDVSRREAVTSLRVFLCASFSWRHAM